MAKSKDKVNVVGGLTSFDKDVLKDQRKITKRRKRRSRKISKDAQAAAARVIGG